MGTVLGLQSFSLGLGANRGQGLVQALSLLQNWFCSVLFAMGKAAGSGDTHEIICSEKYSDLNPGVVSLSVQSEHQTRGAVVQICAPQSRRGKS